jgi:hypothetical protein
MRRPLSLLAFALVMASAFAACSDDPKRPPHAADPSVQPGTPASGGGGGEAGTRDSATPTQDGATLCHDRQLTGIEVQETGVAGDPPAGTGGTLAEGNYDLIEAQKFVGTGTPGATGVTYRASIRITGQLLDRYVRQSGANDKIVRGTFAQTGASITFNATCPTQSQEQLTYTVTSNNLTLTDVIARTSWTFVKK